MSENKKYSKLIVEIADFVDDNPKMKSADIVRIFAEKCGKAPKSMERWLKKAKEYNLERQKLRENTKNDVLIERTKETAIDVENRRLKNIKFFEDIRDGKISAMKIEDNLIVIGFGDRINAAKEINKMDGNYSPVRNSLENPDGTSLLSAITVTVVKTKQDIENAEKE